MSLFTDASIEAARLALHDASAGGANRAAARLTLDAAIAALDETELIEKAAKAIYNVYEGDGAATDDQIARAVLVAIGLLPEETRP